MAFTKIHSFDGTEVYESDVQRPEKYSQLLSAITNSTRCIARGAGLSYCAASGGNNLVSIDLTRFNRILALDEASRLVKVEAGISVGILLQFLIPKGWYFPVLPGYPTITIGGCIANNIHGKSQFNAGNFGNFIAELTLFHPDHGELTCSAKENNELFLLTIGGLGLTGIILDVTLIIEPLKGNSIEKSKVKCQNLFEALEIMKDQKDQYEYVYSWNNLNLSSKKFGEGFVYLEKFCNNVKSEIFTRYSDTITSENRQSLKLGMLNSFTIPIMCAVYYNQDRISKSLSVSGLEKSTFPIYGKEIYFRLFGSSGLREYQLIIPNDNAERFISELAKLKKESKVPIALGSLKIFQGTNRHLNFCLDGVCLAIDIPNRPRYLNFFSVLDSLVMKHNGIANLAKDSRLSAEVVSKMYSGYHDFKNGLNRFDPVGRFTSSLRERIGV
jgi:hypothetical protein